MQVENNIFPVDAIAEGCRLPRLKGGFQPYGGYVSSAPRRSSLLFSPVARAGGHARMPFSVAPRKLERRKGVNTHLCCVPHELFLLRLEELLRWCIELGLLF